MVATIVVACISNVKIDLLLGGSDGRIPYIMAAITNMVLVGLTAGRIWWKRREARQIYATDTLKKQYNTAMIIILESGALYCIIAIVIASTRQPTWEGISSLVIQCASAQLMNIVPTLIIVRAGMGHNIQDTLTDRTATSINQSSLARLPVRPPSSYRILDLQPRSDEPDDNDSSSKNGARPT